MRSPDARRFHADRLDKRRSGRYARSGSPHAQYIVFHFSRSKARRRAAIAAIVVHPDRYGLGLIHEHEPSIRLRSGMSGVLVPLLRFSRRFDASAVGRTFRVIHQTLTDVSGSDGETPRRTCRRIGGAALNGSSAIASAVLAAPRHFSPTVSRQRFQRRTKTSRRRGPDARGYRLEPIGRKPNPRAQLVHGSIFRAGRSRLSSITREVAGSNPAVHRT